MDDAWDTRGLGPALRLRLWLRSSSRAEVGLTLTGAVTALATLVWVVGSVSPGTSQRAVAAPGPQPTPTPGVVAPQPTATAPLVPPLAILPVADAPVGEDGAAAPVLPEAIPPAAPISVGIVVPVAAAPTALLPTLPEVPPVPGVPAPPEPPEVLPPPPTDLGAVGQALLAAANADGGVRGAQVTPVVVTVDPADPASQLAACTTLAAAHVVAVLDTSGLSTGAARRCVTVQHRTPLITSRPGSAAEVRAASPYEVSAVPDETSVMATWVRTLAAQHVQSVGIVTDNCDRDPYDSPGGLKAELARVHVTVADERVIGCDANPDTAGVVPAAQQRLKGVSHVLLAVGPAFASSYLTAAQGLGWHPSYVTAPFRGQDEDLAAQGFRAEQWDGVRGAGVQRQSGPSLVRSVPARACSAALVDSGLDALTGAPADVPVLQLCDAVRIWLAAARASTDWASGVRSLGTFDTAATLAPRFDRGSTGGQVRLSAITWVAAEGRYRRS